jgi:ubiquinone/menaquinone biosynthesis C-methylase UbiE/DNA-binding transcriptional ArsR family regulator
MPSIIKILRVVADPNRLRILLLLRAEELSVAELQEILTMGQSTISTHLSQLKQAALVEDRRTGKSSLYRLSPPDESAGAPGPGSPATGPGPWGGDPSHLGTWESINLDPGLPALKGHDVPNGAEVLKGHDFSRADRANKTTRALAPEGSSSKSSPATTGFLHELLARAASEIPEAPSDQASMRLVLRKRQDKMRTFFDSVAGRLGKDYVPGKSWKSLAEALLRLMPPMVIADLGAGEGASSLLLAQNAKRVIAVDTSAKMIEVARDQALRAGIQNVEYRLGDMEEIPIDSSTVDLAFFSQSLHHALHPARALTEAHRILSPGGRIVILDLAKHRFEEARELYADEWLGFSESDLESMLQHSGFQNIQTSIVHKEQDPPHFQTLLAVANKL